MSFSRLNSESPSKELGLLESRTCCIILHAAYIHEAHEMLLQSAKRPATRRRSVAHVLPVLKGFREEVLGNRFEQTYQGGPHSIRRIGSR